MKGIKTSGARAALLAVSSAKKRQGRSNRKLRTLALVSGAALIALAVAASSAWATYDQGLTGEAATISGSQVTQNVWTTNSGTVKCEKASLAGKGVGAMEEPSAGTTTYAEITVHPTYEECRAFGLAETWTTTGCNFVLTTATTTEKAVTGFDAHAAMHIECEPGHKMIVNAGGGGCILEIGEQTPGGVVDLKNEANGTVLWQWTIEGISYHQEGSKCTGGTGTFANAKLTGTVNFSGRNPNTGAAVTISAT